MDTFDSAIWGQVSKPDSFIELMTLILENKRGNGLNVSYWRGQADIGWKLDSSIVRKALQEHPKNIDSDEIERSITFWEEAMLNKAKKNLFNYDERGRKINDIELLARLQHFGASTRLVDFSKNVLIALWFCASDKRYAKDTGLLIGIDTYVIAGIGESYFDFDQDYSKFCTKLEKTNLRGELDIRMIDAPVITQRISAQRSVFLCSKCMYSKHGYFLLPDEDKYLKKIAISPELKREALDIISAHFDVTPYTIFPDIEGFSSANSSKWSFSECDRW